MAAHHIRRRFASQKILTLLLLDHHTHTHTHAQTHTRRYRQAPAAAAEAVTAEPHPGHCSSLRPQRKEGTRWIQEQTGDRQRLKEQTNLHTLSTTSHWALLLLLLLKLLLPEATRGPLFAGGWGGRDPGGGIWISTIRGTDLHTLSTLILQSSLRELQKNHTDPAAK